MKVEVPFTFVQNSSMDLIFGLVSYMSPPDLLKMLRTAVFSVARDSKVTEKSFGCVIYSITHCRSQTS